MIKNNSIPVDNDIRLDLLAAKLLGKLSSTRSRVKDKKILLKREKPQRAFKIRF